MDDNCGEWVECIGVASGCGEQKAGMASGSGWNLWVWLLGVVVRRYIDFLIPLISRDEPDSPLTQYITNDGISRARFTITLFKHHHRVLQLLSNRISV